MSQRIIDIHTINQVEKKRTVDIYCRVSTEDQEDNTSLNTQEEESKKFARENGFIVGLVHKETASGFTLDRKKLKIMQKRYINGDIQGVIVYKLSRLARKHAFLSYLTVEMEIAGCTLYSVKEKIEKDEQGEVSMFLEGFFAQRERNEIVDRTKTGRYKSAKEEHNVAVGRKPIYGMDWLEDEKKKNRRKLPMKIGFTRNKHIEAVEKAFEWFDPLGGGKSLNWIILELTNLGFPPPDSAWNSKSLKRILRDIRYTGTKAEFFKSNDSRNKYRISEEPVTIPGVFYPKVIEMERYLRVQERLESNGHEARNEELAEHFLLRNGFVFCKVCGQMMTVDHDLRNREWSRYICRARTARPDIVREKHFISISSVFLDKEVWILVEEFARSVEIIQEAIKVVSREDIVTFQRNSLMESIRRHQETVDGYQEDLEKKRVPEKLREMVYQKIEVEMNDIEQLQERLEELQSQAETQKKLQEEYKKIEAWCEKIRRGQRPDKDEELSYREKRDFMKFIGVRVLINNDEKHPGMRGKKLEQLNRERYCPG